MQTNIPSPQELGFPAKYKEWRPGKNGKAGQAEIIADLLESYHRFSVRMVSPGGGKTGIYMGFGAITKSRMVVLTGTKGLQDQVMDDFECMGMKEIKGRSNYNCSGIAGRTCEEGSIGKCNYRGSTLCDWMAAKEEAANAQYVVANYALWIANAKYGLGFGDFDVLVCDEAHSISSWLTKALQIQISEHDCQLIKYKWPDEDYREDMDLWKGWAIAAKRRVDDQFQALEEKIKQTPNPSTGQISQYKRLRDMQRNLADLSSCTPSKWVVDRSAWGYQFDPIDASEYAEKYLFCGIPKVILVSGTVRPKAIDVLGVGKEKYDYAEYGRAADPRLAPLVRVPTVGVSHNSKESDLKKLVERIDETIEIWGMYRGLIQTANNKLRDYIMAESRYSKYMITNYTQNGDVTAEIVRRFKETEPPIILVSASIHTGYDFPGNAARWNVIAKVQFPDDRSKVEQAKKEEDPERAAYHALQYVEQAHGRPNRSDDDWSVSMVFDDNLGWLVERYGHLASSDFHMYYRQSKEVPKPPVNGSLL